MRFEDWDILLFPKDSKVPIKEFMVSCHVVRDPDFSPPHGTYGVPMLCCFIPSLAPRTPYQISIHSWNPSPASQSIQSYFEVRVLVDGHLVETAYFPRASPAWPQVIENTLGFPAFHQEVLQQSFWNPDDATGRIKVILSEVIPRDSPTLPFEKTPFERLNNIVAFSFQHAPLDILESSDIAWPNISMWNRTPSLGSALPALSHAHSPQHEKFHNRRMKTDDSMPDCVPSFNNIRE